VENHCADHATPVYQQKSALTSPTSGGHSADIVRLRNKDAKEFVLFVLFCLRNTNHAGPRYAVSFISLYFIPLRSTYSPQHLALKHPQSVFLRYCQKPVSHPSSTQARLRSCILQCSRFSTADKKTGCSGLNDTKQYQTPSSSEFAKETNFDLLLPFPNISSVTNLQKISLECLCRILDLHSVVETATCTSKNSVFFWT
jgi:hypothetical protein